MIGRYETYRGVEARREMQAELGGLCLTLMKGAATCVVMASLPVTNQKDSQPETKR